jgi:DNA-binding transcriptional MocR family regulator
MIARHTARYTIHVDPENILITSGAQQALDLIGKIFFNPGDRPLVERPTYVGALQAWNAYQAEYITIAVDDEGLQADDLEAALRAGGISPSCTGRHRRGGLFLLVTMPELVDATEILQAAIAENVAFLPGSAFFADGSGRNTFRLTFSNASSARIKEGIRCLGTVLDRVLPTSAAVAEPHGDHVLHRGTCFQYG